MENQQDHPKKADATRETGWEREIIEKVALAAVLMKPHPNPIRECYKRLSSIPKPPKNVH